MSEQECKAKGGTIKQSGAGARVPSPSGSGGGDLRFDPQSMSFPFLGFGVGLRPKHYPEILDVWPAVDWFEVISENFMVPGGRPLHVLERSGSTIRSRCTACHCRSAQPIRWIPSISAACVSWRVASQPAWISDHLCWTGVGGHNLHDLLPLPYTEEALAHVVAPRPPGAGGARPPHPPRERVHVSGVPALGHAGMGVPHPGRRACRLRHSARHQQHLRERLQSRLFAAGVHRRPSRRIACISFIWLGTVTRARSCTIRTTIRSPIAVWQLYGASGAALRRGVDVDRMGRPHPAVRRRCKRRARTRSGSSRRYMSAPTLAQTQELLWKLITAPEGVAAGLGAARSCGRRPRTRAGGGR